ASSFSRLFLHDALPISIPKPPELKAAYLVAKQCFATFYLSGSVRARKLSLVYRALRVKGQGHNPSVTAGFVFNSFKSQLSELMRSEEHTSELQSRRDLV